MLSGEKIVAQQSAFWLTGTDFTHPNIYQSETQKTSTDIHQLTNQISKFIHAE